MRGPNQRPDVAGILNAVHNEQRPISDFRECPDARRDDGENALRCFRSGEIAKRARADFLDCHRVTRQLGRERLAARRAGELGRHERALEFEPGGQRLLHESHAFHDGQAPPAARLAPLEIANGRLQITSDARPRSGHGCT